MPAQSETATTAARVYLFNDTRVDRHHGCSIVMRNLIAGLRQRGAVLTGTLASGRQLGPDDRAALAQADRLVINGEGTLHHDRPYARYLLQTAAAVAAAGKPVYLLNASWEANSPALADWARRFSAIYVRDQASAAELAGHGIDATAVPDLTFLSQYPPALARTAQLLCTDSVLPSLSTELHQLAEHIDGRYLPILQPPALLGPRRAPQKWFKHQLYRGLHALSLGRWQPRQYYRDLRYCLADTEAFLHTLGGARAVVSGRYHATCLALQLQLPLVCLGSNTRKVQNLLADAGLDAERHLCAVDDMVSLPRDELLARADYTAAERSALTAFLTAARQRGNAMLDRVVQAH